MENHSNSSCSSFDSNADSDYDVCENKIEEKANEIVRKIKFKDVIK